RGSGDAEQRGSLAKSPLQGGQPLGQIFGRLDHQEVGTGHGVGDSPPPALNDEPGIEQRLRSVRHSTAFPIDYPPNRRLPDTARERTSGMAGTAGAVRLRYDDKVPRARALLLS